MAAADQVFAITELFEMIVSDLSMRELLVNMRVSRSFRDNTKNSKPLSRKIFLRPAADEFPSFWNGTWTRPHDETETPVQVLENPVLDRLRSLFSSSSSRSMKLPEAWQRGEASWRRMEMTQPPVKGRVGFKLIAGDRQLLELEEDMDKLGVLVEKLQSHDNDRGVQMKRLMKFWYVKIEIEGSLLWNSVKKHGWEVEVENSKEGGEDEQNEEDEEVVVYDSEYERRKRRRRQARRRREMGLDDV